MLSLIGRGLDTDVCSSTNANQAKITCCDRKEPRLGSDHGPSPESVMDHLSHLRVQFVLNLEDRCATLARSRKGKLKGWVNLLKRAVWMIELLCQHNFSEKKMEKMSAKRLLRSFKTSSLTSDGKSFYTKACIKDITIH